MLSFSENVRENSGECYQRFWEMFMKIPWNVIKDLKILGNVPEDSGECKFRLFCEILLVFYDILLLYSYETMKAEKINKQIKKSVSDSSKLHIF